MSANTSFTNPLNLEVPILETGLGTSESLNLRNQGGNGKTEIQPPGYLQLLPKPVKAYHRDIVDSVPDPPQYSKYHNKVRQMHFLVSRAYKSYVYTMLQSIQCTIALYIKKQCTHLIFKMLLKKNHQLSSELSLSHNH